MSLAGAKLAASISPAQRIDMVQRGYSPMNPVDVDNYLNHKAPSGAMLQISTEVLEEGTSMNSFGEKHMSYEKDYQKLASHFDNKGDIDVDSLERVAPRTLDRVNPKEEVRDKLGNYGGKNDNLPRRGVNEKLSEALGKRSIERPVSPTKGLISIPKDNREYITEGAQAKSLGYKHGCSYLNAFIVNLRAPSSENRIKLIKELNTMVLKEESIHPSIVAEYRRGVSTAESELYKNLKSQQG